MNRASFILYKFELNVRLEGIGGQTVPKGIGDVYFQNIEAKLYASTVIGSRYKTKYSKNKLLDATALLERAVASLNFIYKRKITILNEGYLIRKLFDTPRPWITTKITIFPYSIGINHDELADKINMLDPKLLPVINKVFGYYEAAMESTNYYVKVILLVSCVEALIKERQNTNKRLSGTDLADYLDDTRKTMKMRKDRFRRFISRIIHGKIRSSSSHGNIDINDPSIFAQIQEEYQKFHNIVDEYIVDFLDKNKSAAKLPTQLHSSSVSVFRI